MDVSHHILCRSHASPLAGVVYLLIFTQRCIVAFELSSSPSVTSLGFFRLVFVFSTTIIEFFPALCRFRAKADILIPSGRLVYGFSAKDTIFHGRFSINIPGKVVAYQKNLFLPNGMNVSVSAGAQFIDTLPGEPLTKRIKPMCGIQLRFGSGGDGNIVYAGDGFSVKQRVPLPLKLLGVEYPKVDLETFTSVKFPQISSRYSVQNDGLTLGTPPPVGGAGAAGAVREDADTLCVHVQAINAVIRL